MYRLTVVSVALLFFHAYSAPLEDAPTVVPIVSEDNALENNGTFHYSFETGDGIKVHEEGVLKEVGKELAETVSGGFEYVAPDGSPVAISYTADETGYHPVGDVIPTSPPVPEAIAKLVQYIEAHPEIHLKNQEVTS